MSRSRVVRLEISDRGPASIIYSHKAAADCPLYFADDARFKGIREHNEFDALEKERNLKALSRVGAREAILEVQKFFLHMLTGSANILPEHEKKLKKIETRLSSMVGLADQLWVLGYIGPVLIGPHMKQMRDRHARVEYKPIGGFQELPVNGLDGQERILRVPKKIALCWSRSLGKEPKPLLRGGVEPIIFEVSRAFAAKIVKDSPDYHGPGSKPPVAPAPPLVPMREQLARYEQQRQPFKRPKPRRAKRRAQTAEQPLLFGGGRR